MLSQIKPSYRFAAGLINLSRGPGLPIIVSKSPSRGEVVAHTIVSKIFGLPCESVNPAERQAHELILGTLTERLNLLKPQASDLDNWLASLMRSFTSLNSGPELEEVARVLQGLRTQIESTTFSTLKDRFPLYIHLFEDQPIPAPPTSESFKGKTSQSARSTTSKFTKQNIITATTKSLPIDASHDSSPESSCPCCVVDGLVTENRYPFQADTQSTTQARPNFITQVSLAIGGLGASIITALAFMGGGVKSLVTGTPGFSIPALMPSVFPNYASQALAMHDEDHKP